nr:MAG TPA: hypothetical protein [Caudoviricetes sp.]
MVTIDENGEREYSHECPFPALAGLLRSQSKCEAFWQNTLRKPQFPALAGVQKGRSLAGNRWRGFFHI